MGEVLGPEDKPLAPEVLEDGLCGVVDMRPREPAQPIDEHPVLVEGRHHREAVLDAQLEVLFPRPGGDVDEPRPLGLADLLPEDHPVGFWGSEAPG